MTMRPAHSGRLARAAGSFGQFTATRTMSARAASAGSTALAVGPISCTSDASEAWPRLFEISAPIPTLASARAKADPMAPTDNTDPVHVLGAGFRDLHWFIGSTHTVAFVSIVRRTCRSSADTLISIH